MAYFCFVRGYLFLITLALALAFSAGYFFMANRTSAPAPVDPVRQIASLRESFRRGHAPLSEINLSMLFPGVDPLPFLDPQVVLPQNQVFSYPTMARLYREAENCRFGASPITDERLRKAEIWQASRCGRLARLPQRFFETPPFFHPLGKSYALLAAQSGATEAWVQAHLPYFHATELHALSASLEPSRRLIAEWDTETLRAAAEGGETVLTTKYVFLRQARNSSLGLGNNTNTSYAVFAIRVWDRYWAKLPYSVRNASENASCLWREGRACWNVRAITLRRSTFLLLGSSLVLALLCVTFAINGFRRQREAEARKRFALQTLTHELRTPVAGLALASEEVIDQFDAIPSELQGPLLGMCNDVQRLQRVVEASKGYLSSGGGIVQLRQQTLPSTREYLESCLDGYAERIHVTYPQEDRPFRADPYWLGICLTNLVDNGLHHGKPPVEVSFVWRGNALEISVTDGGTCPGKRLAELTQPFVKSPTSSGLGLGLAIVKTVVKAMKSEIRFSTAPTRFWFRLEEI